LVLMESSPSRRANLVTVSRVLEDKFLATRGVRSFYYWSGETAEQLALEANVRRKMFGILFLMISNCIVLGADTTSNVQLPSISELEKLNFKKTVPIQVALPFNQFLAMKQLFVAYEATSKAIARYRDPIVTRGVRGETVFKTVSPAVVAVVVGSVDANDKFNPEGLGTGAIVDPSGYVLTNWHVINGHAGALVFLKPSGTPDIANAEMVGAKVIHQDSTADLALLKMINPPKTLHALSLGDISQVQIAEDIHIVGHPHGNYWSYSTGVISQIRDGYTWKYSDGTSHAAKVLQLQTAINPGNSGGPVVDDAGSILGLVAMSEEGQNLDYAIAADVIKQFLFGGMQMTTRGAQPSVSTAPSTPPLELLSSQLADNLNVLRASYPEGTLYLVTRQDGTAVEAIAKFAGGIVVSGSHPNSDGNFNSWSADLPGGRHFVGVASNGVLSSISETQVQASISR
jgi:S1-C subfamily serine protease